MLILQHGQLASNLTVGHGESSVILSNLEPFHTYQVQVNEFLFFLLAVQYYKLLGYKLRLL